MSENGVEISIRSKAYRLVFTTAALKEIGKKYGGVEEMGAKMDADRIAAIDDVCWLVALLANQGIMLDTGITAPGNPDLLTADKVALLTMPWEIEGLSKAAIHAIELGMAMEHPASDGPVDVVLEELRREDKKKEDSLAG
jgi:hypothetical protein